MVHGAEGVGQKAEGRGQRAEEKSWEGEAQKAQGRKLKWPSATGGRKWITSLFTQSTNEPDLILPGRS